MNKRVSLKNIAAWLLSQYALPGGINATYGVTVATGTCYDVDYVKSFGQAFPKVWVRAQRMSKLTDASGSVYYTQKMGVQVAISLCVQRYAAGNINPEQFLNDLFDATTQAMADWSGDGGSQLFTNYILESSRDGISSETSMTVDLVVSATVIYRSPVP